MSLPNHLFLYSQLLSLIGQGVTTVPVEVELPGILCVGVSQMYNQVLKRTKPSGTAANFASTERADELRGTISLEESFVVLVQVRLSCLLGAIVSNLSVNIPIVVTIDLRYLVILIPYLVDKLLR